jgi:hypothetical protein
MGRSIDDDQAGAILNAVVDSWINWVDTSPDYGVSEELIGRHLSKRRSEFFLASKCGCFVSPDGGTSGFGDHDFSRSNVRAGVEQSLRRMNTEHLDLVQFHATPSRETLEQNDSVAELVELRSEGKSALSGCRALCRTSGVRSTGAYLTYFRFPTRRWSVTTKRSSAPRRGPEPEPSSGAGSLSASRGPGRGHREVARQLPRGVPGPAGPLRGRQARRPP